MIVQIFDFAIGIIVGFIIALILFARVKKYLYLIIYEYGKCIGREEKEDEENI